MRRTPAPGRAVGLSAPAVSAAAPHPDAPDMRRAHPGRRGGAAAAAQLRGHHRARHRRGGRDQGRQPLPPLSPRRTPSPSPSSTRACASCATAVAAALDALPPDAEPAGLACTPPPARTCESSLRNSDYTSASLRTFAHLPDAPARAVPGRPAALRGGLGRHRGFRGGQGGAACAPASRTDVVRLMLLGAVNWAGEWYRPGRISIDRIARDFAELIFGHAPGGFR